MRRYEIRTSTVEETTDEQIKALAASFYPTIKAFFNTDEGRKMFEDYMDEVNDGTAGCREEAPKKPHGCGDIKGLPDDKKPAA